MKHIDPFFTAFDESLTDYSIPEKFVLSSDTVPHPICVPAVNKLQAHIESQDDWSHNFGLAEDGSGTVIGKMFGVLVVQTEQDETGYLSAFSGKLAGANHHQLFVPPVFDGLADGSFLNSGMRELSRINEAIKKIEIKNQPEQKAEILRLKTERKTHSNALQKKLFDHYHFLNRAGETKSLRELFSDADYKNPPAGAGECAAPKLLQYAFQHKMKPLALAEFWWGQSPKSDFWKHGHFYPSCEEKCKPILAHMLEGIDK